MRITAPMSDPGPVSKWSRAFRRGYLAAGRREKRDNPYVAMKAGAEWDAGWDYAVRQREQNEELRAGD